MLSTAEPLHAPDSKDIFFHKFNFIERYDYSMISKHLMLQFIIYPSRLISSVSNKPLTLVVLKHMRIKICVQRLNPNIRCIFKFPFPLSRISKYIFPLFLLFSKNLLQFLSTYPIIQKNISNSFDRNK